MLLFCYFYMALVIKAQSGATIYKPYEDSIKYTNGIHYKSSDALTYLKNEEMQTRYSDFRNFNDKQRQDFTSAIKEYTKAIESGLGDFGNDGLIKFVGTDNTYTPYVNDYFLLGIRNGDIIMYDESTKPKYEVNISRILATNVFNNPELSESSLLEAWKALDPKDAEGNRGVKNRISKYAEAMRKEAQRLENTPDYTNTYQFIGWQDDLNAYKQTAQKLRQHADLIEKLTDVINTDSWIPVAAELGMSPTAIKTYFKPENIEEQTPQNNLNNLNDLDTENSNLSTQAEGWDYQDPLATNNTIVSAGGKTYTIDDNWQNIDNEEIKNLAQRLISANNRLQIKSNWTFWKQYKGKYLQNLSNMFDKNGIEDFLGIYAVTSSPVSNVGKQFFIRTSKLQYPVLVDISVGVDGKYYAKDKKGNTYNLGNYAGENWYNADTSLHLTNDIGIPFDFSLNILLGSSESVRDYMLKAIYPLHNSANYWPQLWWANMLMLLSYYFWKNQNNGRYLLRLPNGVTIELGGDLGLNSPVSSFTWRHGAYGIRFNFLNGRWILGKSKGGRNKATYIDPNTIKDVQIIYPVSRKVGGVIKLQYGGISDAVNFATLNNLISGYTIERQKSKKSKTNTAVPFKDLSKKQKLASDTEFTTADRIRTAAAGLDLLSAIMSFSPGLQIASTVGTGTAFGGYITADIMDVVEGRQKLGDVAVNDAIMLGTMAVPMFINPRNAAKLGLGKQALESARIFSKFLGWGVAVGMIANEETRKSLSNTINKLLNLELTSLNSADVSNIAFMVRMVSGVNLGIKGRSAQKQLSKAQETNGNKIVKYSVKNGENTINGELDVTNNTDFKLPSIKDLILKQINEGRETPFKAEDITVPTVDESWFKTVYRRAKETLPGVKKDTPNDLIVKWESIKADIQEPGVIYNRIFEKTKFTPEGKVERVNTPLGKLIRSVLGKDFDVFFSDYNTVKGYRLAKLRRLNENVYKPLDLLREQGKRLNEIVKLDNLTKEQIDAKLVEAMKEFGFYEKDPGLVAYARKLADFYETDLSTLNNLQLAQQMFDYGKTEKTFGKVPQGEVKKTTLNPEGLEYTPASEAKVTPEDLQDAYNIFLKEKSTTPLNNMPLTFLQNLLRLNNVNNPNNTQTAAHGIFLNFNSDIAKPIQLDIDRTIANLLKIPAVLRRAARSWTYGRALSTNQVRSMLNELVKNGTLTKQQADHWITNGIDDYLKNILNSNEFRQLSSKLLLDYFAKLAKASLPKDFEKGKIPDFNLFYYNLLSDSRIRNLARLTVDLEDAYNHFLYKYFLKEIKTLKKQAINTEKNQGAFEQEAKHLAEKIKAAYGETIPELTTDIRLHWANEVALVNNGPLLNRLETNIKLDKAYNLYLYRLVNRAFEVAKTKEPQVNIGEFKPIAEPKPVTEVKPANAAKPPKVKNKKGESSIIKINDIVTKIKSATNEISLEGFPNKKDKLKRILNYLLSTGKITEAEYNELISDLGVFNSKFYNTLIKSVPKKAEGGTMEFVHKVLKFLGGGDTSPLTTPGITYKSGKLNWEEIAPRLWEISFNLLKDLNNQHLLGTGAGSFYDLGNLYYSFNRNFLRGELNDKDKVTAYLAALPTLFYDLSKELVESGRYLKNSEEWNLWDDNLKNDGYFQAAMADLIGFGNLEMFSNTSLQSLLEQAQSNLIKLAYDSQTGNIFPVSDESTLSDGQSLLTSDFNLSEWQKNQIGSGRSIFNYGDSSKITKTNENTGRFGLLPGDYHLKGSGHNAIRLLDVLFTNWNNRDTYNKTKTKPVKELPVLETRKTYRDILSNSDILNQYSETVNTYADPRIAFAAKLANHNSMREALAKQAIQNAKSYTESENATVLALQNSNKNAITAANANAVAEQKAIDSNNELYHKMRMAFGENVHKLAENIVKERYANWRTEHAYKIPELKNIFNSLGYNKQMKVRLEYYNKIIDKLRYDPEALAKFKSEYPIGSNFWESPYGKEFESQITRELLHIDAQTSANILGLYDSIFDYDNASWRFRNVKYPYYKIYSGDEDDLRMYENLQNNTVKPTINTHYKDGGIIDWNKIDSCINKNYSHNFDNMPFEKIQKVINNFKK